MSPTIIRPPVPAEASRVAHLFRHMPLRPDARVLLAVRQQPVERFVAGAAWWSEGEFGRFQLALSPGVNRAEILPELVLRVAADARAERRSKLLFADLVPDTSEWCDLLRQEGFDIMRSERFFSVSIPQCIPRLEKLMQAFRRGIPPTWKLESIREHPPEAVFELVAAFRLMPEAEIVRLWHGNQVSGFHPAPSCILFDGPKPIGTLLVRVRNQELFYDIRVVTHPNPRLRALGNLCLLHFGIPYYYTLPAGTLQTIQFRGGEAEHLETANLAYRMGGTEMPARHVFAKDL